mmetsp:Transcript_7592/g.30046  ORF Transcript_7592/g.30046 Transcript_7592/m.30046 type:complete len:273 (+) Transcript_7592:903-1721(+)
MLARIRSTAGPVAGALRPAGAPGAPAAIDGGTGLCGGSCVRGRSPNASAAAAGRRESSVCLASVAPRISDVLVGSRTPPGRTTGPWENRKGSYPVLPPGLLPTNTAPCSASRLYASLCATRSMRRCLTGTFSTCDTSAPSTLSPTSSCQRLCICSSCRRLPLSCLPSVLVSRRWQMAEPASSDSSRPTKRRSFAASRCDRATSARTASRSFSSASSALRFRCREMVRRLRRSSSSRCSFRKRRCVSASLLRWIVSAMRRLASPPRDGPPASC